MPLSLKRKQFYCLTHPICAYNHATYNRTLMGVQLQYKHTKATFPLEGNNNQPITKVCEIDNSFAI